MKWQKKSPNQETGSGNRGHLKVLKDIKLVLNEHEWHSESFRINLTSFKASRGPIFPKPVSWLRLFFRSSLQQTCSNSALSCLGLKDFCNLTQELCMLCMDSPVVHHLSPNIHTRQWDCISHKTFPFFVFHHHSFLSISSKKSSLNTSKLLNMNNNSCTKLYVLSTVNVQMNIGWLGK